MTQLKFIYSEKAKNFCEIFTLLLKKEKSKVKISQNFVAFSEYMNFTGKVVSVLEAGKNLKFAWLFSEQCSRLPI